MLGTSFCVKIISLFDLCTYTQQCIATNIVGGPFCSTASVIDKSWAPFLQLSPQQPWLSLGS